MSRGDKLRARVIFPNVRIDVRREGEREREESEATKKYVYEVRLRLQLDKHTGQEPSLGAIKTCSEAPTKLSVSGTSRLTPLLQTSLSLLSPLLLHIPGLFV